MTLVTIILLGHRPAPFVRIELLFLQEAIIRVLNRLELLTIVLTQNGVRAQIEKRAQTFFIEAKKLTSNPLEDKQTSVPLEGSHPHEEAKEGKRCTTCQDFFANDGCHGLCSTCDWNDKHPEEVKVLTAKKEAERKLLEGLQAKVDATCVAYCDTAEHRKHTAMVIKFIDRGLQVSAVCTYMMTFPLWVLTAAKAREMFVRSHLPHFPRLELGKALYMHILDKWNIYKAGGHDAEVVCYVGGMREIKQEGDVFFRDLCVQNHLFDAYDVLHHQVKTTTMC